MLLLIMRSQHCWSCMEHSVLYIFDINIVWPYERCKFIWLFIWLTSTINVTGVILLIQLWATKINIFLFLLSLMLKKVAFSTCGKVKIVFVGYWCQLKLYLWRMIIYFIKNSNCINISNEWVSVLTQFLLKKIWLIY